MAKTNIDTTANPLYIENEYFDVLILKYKSARDVLYRIIKNEIPQTPNTDAIWIIGKTLYCEYPRSPHVNPNIPTDLSHSIDTQSDGIIKYIEAVLLFLHNKLAVAANSAMNSD